MKFSIRAFFGQAPRRAANLLAESQATLAENVRLSSGSLRPINASAPITATIATATKSIYSLGGPSASVILSWPTDVDVARGPVSDSEYKIYYTDGTAPRKTSYALATSGSAPFPAASYLMGTPAPTTAPTLGSTTGSVAAGTYAYLFTYVTQFGSVLLEESAPSPAATITLGATGGVTVTFPTNPSTTGRNYVFKRVYRAASTTYQLVAEVPFANASFTDNLAAASIPGTALPSLGWLPPPNDLRGLCSLPSGVMVGFRNNEIWFSEPGFPHAWPVRYMQVLDSTIVAIKAFGNNVAVATEQHPYMGTGLFPDSFTFTKLPLLEPCVSKRSMAADDSGAIYASRNGLVSISLDGIEVATRDLVTRQEFNDYTPSSMLGVVFEGRYYGFYTTTGSSGSQSAALVFGRGEREGLRRIAVNAGAVTLEVSTNRLFYVDGVTNALLDFDPLGTAPMTFVWQSKRFDLPYPTNMSCFVVQGPEISPEQQAAAAAINALNATITANNATALATNIRSALNTHALNTRNVNGSLLRNPLPPLSTTVSVVIYAASQPVYSLVADINRMYRLPSGFRATGWQVRLSGQSEVTSFEMATSATELKQS